MNETSASNTSYSRIWITRLITEGTEVSHEQDDGKFAIWMAAEAGHYRCIKILLDAKARANWHKTTDQKVKCALIMTLYSS